TVDLFITIVSSKYDYTRIRELSSNSSNGFDSTEDRHTQINQRHLWFMLAIQINGLLSIDSLSNHLHVRYSINQGDKTLPHDRLVVDYHDSDLVVHSFYRTERGSAGCYSLLWQQT